jgi:GH18 family chitinase
MATKAQYVQDSDLGGIMLWEITGDRNETLMDVIVEGLGGQLHIIP